MRLFVSFLWVMGVGAFFCWNREYRCPWRPIRISDVPFIQRRPNSERGYMTPAKLNKSPHRILQQLPPKDLSPNFGQHSQPEALTKSPASLVTKGGKSRLTRHGTGDFFLLCFVIDEG